MDLTKGQRRALAFAAKYRSEATYTSMAKHIGVAKSTIFRWRQANPEFADALERAKAGIVETDYEAVSIEQFIRDPDYLGIGIEGLDEGGRVWPQVAKELADINSGRYDLVLLVGGLGAAKTYSAVVSLVYQLYLLLMHEDPHSEYGLDPASPIIVAVQNRSRKLAERNDYALARNLIASSPWFQRYAPWDERLKSRVKFLNRNIELWPASGDAEDLLGMNLFGLALDEANFFNKVERSRRAHDGGQYDAAREAFEGALRRKQSRFRDGSGLFFVASSRRYKGQFTDELQSEFVDDPRCYVYSHNQWSIRPERYQDSPWFSVFKGDRLRPPRVLADDEKVDAADRGLIIQIPERFRRRFESDPVRSLQDLAGISTEISGGFFTDKERLGTAASLMQRIVAVSDAQGDATHLAASDFVLDCPESPRHVHGDLSLTGDLTGLACGFIHHYDEQGLPHIHVDAVARVRPPRDGQIELDSVLRLVRLWISQGVPIRWTTFDGYQSADLLQRVSRLGVAAARLSADQTKPTDPMAAYETLRAAISEGRFKFPDDAGTVEDMLWLQCDYEKRRVDHLPGRKKDTADCLAAIAYHLTHQVTPFTLAGVVEGAGYACTVAQPKLAGEVTPIYYQGYDSHMEMLRANRGIYR